MPDPASFEIDPDRHANQLFPARHIELREDIEHLIRGEAGDEEPVLRMTDIKRRLGFALLVESEPGGDNRGGIHAGKTIAGELARQDLNLN